MEQALLVNVIAWRSPIEYHIFGGDDESFQKWHPQLSNVLSIGKSDLEKDSLIFHPSISVDGIENLMKMDRIIIAEDSQEENIICLNRVIHAGINVAIHVLCNHQIMYQLQYMPEHQMIGRNYKIISFGDDEDMYSPQVIMHGELSRAAKEAHIVYVQKSLAKNIRLKYNSCHGCRKNGECGDCLQTKYTWDDLSPLEKESNIAVADHEVVKRYLVAESEKHGGLRSVKKELCRIEHERWCRFYFLHNWRYGEKRNDSARIHPLLKAFDDLPAVDQEKDWWAYNGILNEEMKRNEKI